jgi:LacI family transcriptional regulator
MDEDSAPPRTYSNVVTDDFAGGQLAVNHLLELGHEKIGIVLPQGGDSVYQERRLAAYISCMEEAGELPAEPIEVPGDWGKMNRIRPIRENRTLLKQFTEFTALFCFNDALAGEVIKYLKHHGISVPEDISVVGYDDTEFGWALDITSIRQPVKSIGKKAVELLVQQIQDEHAPKVQISFPPELVVRHSSGVQSLPVYN